MGLLGRCHSKVFLFLTQTKNCINIPSCLVCIPAPENNYNIRPSKSYYKRTMPNGADYRMQILSVLEGQEESSAVTGWGMRWSRTGRGTGSLLGGGAELDLMGGAQVSGSRGRGVMWSHVEAKRDVGIFLPCPPQRHGWDMGTRQEGRR